MTSRDDAGADENRNADYCIRLPATAKTQLWQASSWPHPRILGPIWRLRVVGWWWGIVDLSIARRLAFGCRTAQDGGCGLSGIGAGGCGGDRRRGSRGPGAVLCERW